MDSLKLLRDIGFLDEEDRVDITTNSVSICYRELTFVPAFQRDLIKNITHLNLGHNSITDIDNIKHFPALNHLVLDNNEINDGTAFPLIFTLKTLELNNNKLKNIAELSRKLSKSFPVLEYLSLLGNPGYDEKVSRSVVLKQLHSLQFLDFKPVHNACVRYSPPEKYTTKKKDTQVKQMASSYTGRNSEGNRFIKNNDL